MNETMGVVVEVWPLAADSHGIWLLSGGEPWRSAPIAADSEPHFELEMTLTERGVHAPALLHSTSWRPDGPHVVLTYVAVLHLPGLARDEWADALPVSEELLPAVGNPTPHDAAEVPVPRHVDVLHHALRHLRFLLDTDSSARQALNGQWSTYLDRMTPALAGMYEAGEGPADIPGQR